MTMTRGQSSFAIAALDRPRFNCPDWCTVTQESHLEDLADWAGFAFHCSARIKIGSGLEVHLTVTTAADGTPDPTDQAMINFTGLDGDDGLPVAAAGDFAAAIMHLCGVADGG